MPIIVTDLCLDEATYASPVGLEETQNIATHPESFEKGAAKSVALSDEEYLKLRWPDASEDSITQVLKILKREGID